MKADYTIQHVHDHPESEIESDACPASRRLREFLNRSNENPMKQEARVLAGGPGAAPVYTGTASTTLTGDSVGTTRSRRKPASALTFPPRGG